MIRVLVVDDHDFVRTSVAEFLTAAGGIEVVGECSNGASVASAATILHPDVILMDVQMPDRSGIEATRDVLAVDPRARVLMFTGAANNRWLDHAVSAGARGYLVKSADPQRLVRAVRLVASGGTDWP